MEQFFSIFVILLVGFYLGWEARERAARKTIDRYLDKLEQDIEQEKKDSINIKIERNGDFFYVFETATDAFIGQATNRADLEKVLGEKFPGKRFYATPENLKEVGFK